MVRKTLVGMLFALFTAFAAAQEAPAPAAPAAPAPAAPAAPAPAAAPAPKSLMEQIGSGEAPAPAAPPPPPTETPEQKAAAVALQAAEKDTRRPKDVPSKYWNPEKGEVNFEAWAKSTTELETRMRTVGLPPKEATEYKFEVPENLKAMGIDMDHAQAKQFRDLAHGMGLTQKQYEGVMGAYMQNLPQLADQAAGLSFATAQKELLSYYKTEEALQQNVRGAYKVFMEFADEKDKGLIDTIGNIPAVVRVLAKIAPELAEDEGMAADAVLGEESLAHLMRGGPGKEDSPYWNKEHPLHAATVGKVTAHHQAAAKSRQRKAA